MVKQLFGIYSDSVSPTFSTSEDDIQGERVFYIRNSNSKHKDYTEEFHEAEEEAITAIEEDHNIEPGLELEMLMCNKNITLKFQVKKKPNPLDCLGNISRCIICESIFFWTRNCPRACENQSPTSEKTPEIISLFQSPDHDIDEMRVFGG